MRYQLYRFFNFLVRLIPQRILRHQLNALHRFPDVADRVGYQVYPQNFSNPFPEPNEVDSAKLHQKRHLPGISLDLDKALKLVEELTRFSQEAGEMLSKRPVNLIKYWDITYPPNDTAILYSMLRYLKPKRYIEVGCGYSSRTSSAALKRNAQEGHPCNCVYIEPSPPKHLAGVTLPGEFREEKVQDTPMSRFQELESGDVLFLDTSHVIKVQNDVEHEFLRILPLLKPGVMVHIHDIFTPYDYPEAWLVGNGPNRGGPNEQYALECLLSHSDKWQIILPSYHLWHDHRKEMNALLDSDERPAGFWIRRRA